uniref:Carrier domain-containing protein n=1 Tax=Angiostrongylus cantonensis TaxID=6313 RepID=A0A0K0DHI3_ANGCA
MIVVIIITIIIIVGKTAGDLKCFRSQTLVKHMYNATFSATAVQCYRATTKRFNVNFCDDDRINHPVVSKISGILKMSEENVAMFAIDEITHLVQITANENTITSELNLTMAIVELLQVFMNLSTPISSIEQIDYPVICFGSIKLLVQQKADDATIEIYNHFDVLSGKWTNIRLQGESSRNTAEKTEKAIAVESESPTLKCMLKIGIDCSEENRHETFTSMGLDSLKTAELEMALQADYPNYRIPTGIVCRCPTIAEMDAYLLSRADIFDINKDTTVYSHHIPLSSQQKRLLFMNELDPARNAQFNENLAFSMSYKNFDERRLLIAMNSVVMTHTILRTSYTVDSQRIHSGTESFLAILECDFVSFPVDISKSICLVVHHIAVDGHSISIITQEIEPQNLNPRQYKDYCVLTSDLSYKFQLLPTDKPRTSAKSFNGAILQRRLTNKLQESLKRIRKLTNCTNFCVFVAIYKFLIYKTTSIADFPIGFPSTSRSKEFWSTVGCFVNTTPLLEVARRIDVPLDVLVSYLKIDRSDDILPIFQVLLVMDNIKATFPNQDIVLLDLPNRLVKYEQTWYFQDNGTSINIRVEYNCDLYRAETISDLLDRFLEQKSIIETSALNRSDLPEKTVFQIFQKNLYSNSSKQRTNYRELDEKSSHMAADICRIYSNHYGELPSRDRCAAVFMKRSLELLVTIVAIWKIGLTVVPISLDWPPERTIETLKMFENPILIENDSERLKNTAGHRIFPVIILRNLSDLAYITCTSGTTGRPKAVCTEFYGHSNLAVAYTRMFLIREQSHIYQVVNYGFDIFFADLSKTLVNGASITLADGLIPNLEEMNGVTNAYIMPVYLSSLSITDIKSLDFVESIQFGGETIQALALRRLLETDISIYQEYGVTEQTVYTNCNRMNVRSAISEIGKPHCNLYTVVRDPNEQLLPLKYQGCGLARGYYTSVIHQGLLGKEFRTGDMVKSNNGRLQFVGRDDLQVKIRGRRIELLEASFFGNHISFRHSYVDDNDGMKELVAYVILKESKESTDSIRSFVSSRLPGYCIPKYFINLKDFPVNQNGKIDISQFPKPRRHSSSSNLRHPRNKLETTVITSFRKYTGRDHMANESFFARGGDSIKVAMLVLQDLAAQGLHIDLKCFFSLQTAEKIASFLNENSMSLRKSREDKTLSCNISLSAQQRRLWFLVKMYPNRDSYVIRLHIDFIGVLIKKRLLESFNLVVMNNSLLRSIITLTNHEPTFLTLSGTECFHALEPNELEDVQVTDSSLVIGQLFERDCSRLDLRIHHIISDGRSLAIIGEQLASAYNGLEIIHDDKLAENDELDDSLDFWREYLEDYEPIAIQGKGKKNEEFCANYCFGTTIANRSPVNLNRVGLFANTIPLRFKENFPDLERQLRYTIDQILSAMEHQSTSLYVVTFESASLSNFPSMNGLRTKVTEVQSEFIQFDQSWIFHPGKKLSLLIQYNTGRYPLDSVKELLAGFKKTLWNILNDVTYDTLDIQHHLESLALSDLRVKVSNSKSVELFYSCDTNKNEVIREKLKQLPEPLRPNTFEFPLSTQQLQMYYLSHEKSSFYVLPFLKKFSKTIPVSHIQKALLYEIQRHESLRTIFFEIQGEPKQLVLSMTEAYIGLNVEKTADLNRSLTIFTGSPVHLTEGVPLRAVLFETPDYFVAMLRLHHIISDAWSTSMLEQELGEILEKLNAFENPKLQRQTLSYKEYCLEAQPTPVINSLYIDALTKADNIPEMSSYRGGVEVLSFDFSESVAHQWMKRCGVSLFVVMLTILSKSIMKEYGMKNINIGSASSGRSSGSKNVFGYFLNNLTLQQHVAEVISRNVPYPQLVDIVRQRGRHLRPLFQVYFNCRYDMETHKDDDITVKSLLQAKSEFPFEIDLDKDSKDYYVTLRVKDCLSKGAGESLMKAIRLNTMFHDMMAYGTRQAMIEPDVYQVTYEELADVITRQAAMVRDHYCQISGETLRADTIIPVLGQRSASTNITCLSIMASGSAYLPMDSSWPLERLCRLLDDSHANCYVDLAYVIYTSGTTGIPKAVCINRRSLVNMMASSTVGFRIHTEDVIYQFTMFVYDNSVLEIFITLANGARLVVAQGEFLPRTFTNLLTNHGITHCLLFPGVVSTFRDANFKKLSALRYWIVGAEKLPQDLLNRAIDEEVNVIQNYGPTETTAYALTKHMKKGDQGENIGRPIQNTTISVTEEGQLLIRGKGVMRGYLNKQSDEWYSTGDRVQLLPNGDVLFVGRTDSQVKIHGHRVELSEIEATITSLDGVDQCKVVWRASDEKLLAFCTRQPEDNLDEELVQERCRKSLPKHMCPTHVIFLDRFPLTENSKIDVAVLSENWKDFLRMKSFLQLLEHVLGKKPLLKHQNFGNNDHFYFCGGNSMSLTKLRYEVNKEFRTNFEVRDLLKVLVFNDMMALFLPSTAKPQYLLIFVHTLYGGCTAYANLIHHFRQLGSVDILMVEHPNTFRFETDEARFHENIQLLADGYYTEVLTSRVALIGASIGGTIAFEMSKHSRGESDVIIIDSGTDYEKLHDTNEALSNYELDDETRSWMVVNSWDLLQMLKDYKLSPSPNLRTLTVLSVDGTDLGWSRSLFTNVFSYLLVTEFTV